MGRQPCCDKLGVKKGPWTAEEDKKLINFILTNGHCCWRAVPKLAGLRRCGKSCRLRWTNYLRPDLKRGLLSEAEEQLVIELHARLGNRWSKIAARLPGRTDNEIKNHWNTHIKKKLLKMGLDPATHEPLHDKQPLSEETASNACHSPESAGNHAVPESDSIITSENNSSSPTENCINNESLMLDNICINNESLGNSLWQLDEAPLVDAASWENQQPTGENICSYDLSFPSLEENCAWLLDCHDFGIHDFGFDCFSTGIELNVLNPILDMGSEKH